MKMGKWAWLLLAAAPFVAGCADFWNDSSSINFTLSNSGNILISSGTAGDGHLDHHCNAIGFNHRDGGADVRGYHLVIKRDQPGDVLAFLLFDFDQRHHGGNLDADGDHHVHDHPRNL
jgi:hypothetical protein